MTRRRIAAGAVLLVAGVVAIVLGVALNSGGRRTTTVTGGHGPARPGAPSIGVNVNYVFNTMRYSPAQQLAILRTLARTGVDTARTDALWEFAEPSPGHMAPGFDDDIVLTLAEAGLRWQPIVDYAPAWARAQPALPHSPPADAARYAAFAAWLARRYGPGGGFWAAHPSLTPQPVRTYELWNEPDVPLFWSPQPNAAAYAALYLAGRAAIHATDPHAVVLVGGLAHASGTLAALLGAAPRLRGAIDGVAIHPYGTSTEASVLDGVRSARATLVRLGLRPVPLYLTEFGWVTAPPRASHYVPWAARPALLGRTVEALAHTDCGVDGEVLYTWITPRQNGLDPEQWYGIEPVGDAMSGVLSSDAAALAAAVAVTRARTQQAPLCGG